MKKKKREKKNAPRTRDADASRVIPVLVSIRAAQRVGGDVVIDVLLGVVKLLFDLCS
jgi:hypothetical protein